MGAFMEFIRTGRVVLGIALLALSVPTANAAKEEDYPRDGTVKIEKGKNLKGIEQVLVPHFAISFVVADAKSAVASTEKSNRFARKASSTTRAELVGLSYDTMQAITDAAYADFVQTLQDNGITVVEPDAAAAQAKARTAKMPMTKFLDTPEKNYSPYRKSFNQNIQDLTFSPTGTQLIAPKIGNTHVPYMYGASARELEVPVLVVDYVLTFGHIAAEAREYYGIAGRGNASAKTSFEPGLQIMWSSDIKSYKSERKWARVMIEKNAWTAESFGTADTEKWNGLSGSNQEITITVDNDLYQKAAMDVISRASDNLIANMAAQ